MATKEPQVAKTLSGAPRLFSISMLVSGIRCVLAYVAIPLVTPFVGLAPGVGAALGVVVGSVAIGANLYSMRRFWRLHHPWRKPVTVLHVGVIAFLLVLLAMDGIQVVGRG